MEESDRIFRKFARGREVESSPLRGRGIGMGLWVARQLMLLANGDLLFEPIPDKPRITTMVVQLRGLESTASREMR